MSLDGLRRPTPWRVVAVVGACLAATSASVSVQAPPAGADDSALFGEGGSFAEPLVLQLEHDGAAAITPLVAGYFDANVDQGREDFASGSADFAVSEFPLTQQEATDAAKNGRSFAYVPFAASAVAISAVILCANDSSLKPGTLCPNLQLTVPQLAKVFTNAVTSWTDPLFAQAQGGSPITPTYPTISAIHEVEPSYSNLAMATLFENNSLAKPVWESFLTTNKISSDAPSELWPTGGGASGGDRALADALIPVNESTGVPQQNPQLWGNGTIAPLPSEWLGAPRNLPTVAVINAAGAFVSPPRPGGSVDSMTAAEKYATLDPATNWVTYRFSATDPAAYPIPAMDYLIVPTSGLDQIKATALAGFIRFVLGTAGQADVQALGAAPVTAAMVTAGMHVADAVAAQQTPPSASPTTMPATTAATTGSGATGSGAAGSGPDCSSCNSSATTAGASGGSLAFTGSDPWPIVALGSALVVAGLLGRRRLVRRLAVALAPVSPSQPRSRKAPS
jgi:phosphate transport system substrate-binding protein